MSDPLATYLHDHMAGSHFAIKLLESLREQYSQESLADFARALESDVKQDQQTLQGIIDNVGKAHLDLTETAGWFAEKASQFKLQRDDSDGGIGTFEALETLMTPGPYACGDKVTIADVCLVPQVANARRLKVPLERFPKIVSVDAACRALEAFDRARPENQPDAE